MSLCIPSGQNVQLELTRGRVLGFERIGSVVVSCLEGSVWITAPASEDIVLSARETTTVAGHGRIVVQALNTARVQVAEIRAPFAAS